jgi:acylphosphatase
MEQVYLIATGKVQKVGFRVTVQRYARNMTITGTVANLSDGSVEIYAQGSHHQLEQFVELIRNHNSNGYVQELAIDWQVPENPFIDFQILSSRSV